MRQAWRCKEDTGGSGYYKEISAREHTRRRIRVNSQYSVALADGDTHNEADSGRGSGRQIDVMRVCRDAVTLFQGGGEEGRRGEGDQFRLRTARVTQQEQNTPSSHAETFLRISSIPLLPVYAPTLPMLLCSSRARSRTSAGKSWGASLSSIRGGYSSRAAI